LLLDRGELWLLFQGVVRLLLVLVVVGLHRVRGVVFPFGQVRPSQRLIGQGVLVLLVRLLGLV